MADDIDPWDDRVIAAQARAMRGRRRLPRLGDGVTESINLLESYVKLAAVAMARAEFYGELLEEQLDLYGDVRPDDATSAAYPGPVGTGGLIGYTYSAAVTGPAREQTIERIATGEQVRALVELESRERDRAAKLIKDAVGMGATMQQIEVIRAYAGTVSAALTTLVGELGMSLDDEPVLRAAQRAGLAARRAMGADDGDPDVVVGARLSAPERVHALRAALARAEDEQARALR